MTSGVILDHNVIWPKFIADIGGDHVHLAIASALNRSNQYRLASVLPRRVCPVHSPSLKPSKHSQLFKPQTAALKVDEFNFCKSIRSLRLAIAKSVACLFDVLNEFRLICKLYQGFLWVSLDDRDEVRGGVCWKVYFSIAKLPSRV